jgi:hypothetical protein
MATTRLADVVVPEEFTSYIVQNTMEKSALVAAGVAVRNAEIEAQLTAGADSFTVPNWFDLGNDEADIVSDDPAVDSVPRKLVAGRQVVRKAFLHNSWSAMNLASELAGDDAIARIKDRAAAYWTRQLQKRLVATLNGILADNEASNAGDMVFGTAATAFDAVAIINAAATLGDSMRDLSAVAMHSDVYAQALRDDLIATERQSDGGLIQTFRGLAVVVDDGMPFDDVTDTYVTALFGAGAVGYGVVPPRIAEGTEVENKPSSGNGGGQQILHSRVNLAVHPAGFSYTGIPAAVSPSLAELADAANWARVFERKAIPLAFLRHTV